eukprot:scaffold36704_cov168-Amphora_coffeaeformis.AAC.2
MDAFRGDAEAVRASNGALYPVFFPPAILHRPKNNNEPPVMINQVGACMIYLGDQLGYAPQTPAEAARANSILLNALDYISEGRKSFHPVLNSMSYHDQKEQGDKASKEFCQRRLRFFLYHLEKVVAVHGSAKPVAGGTNLTYADFALFHVLDATACQFNSDFYEKAWDKLDVPHLKQFYATIKSRPNLQAYFQSD